MPADSAENAEVRPPVAAPRDTALSLGGAEFKSLFEGHESRAAAASAERRSESAIATLELDASSLYHDSFSFHPTTRNTETRLSGRESSHRADAGIERGEPLGRGLSNSDKIEVKEGDTLDSIARARLGDTASDKEIETFKRATRYINEIGKDAQPNPGTTLSLPTKDGSGRLSFSGEKFTLRAFPNGVIDITASNHTIRDDGNGVITFKEKGGPTTVTDVNAGTSITSERHSPQVVTRWKDGSSEMKLTDKDGITATTTDADRKLLKFTRTTADGVLSFVRTPDGKGGFVDEHSGDRPERKFTLHESASGALEVTDASSDKPQKFCADVHLSEPRTELLALASRHISDPILLSKFKGEMIRFENRAMRENLPASEIQQTYKALSRVLGAADDAKLPPEARSILAQQIIAQAANPSIIDQGGHNTCAVASMENVVYSTQPSKAAEMLADVALAGKFKGSDGTTVEIPESNLKPIKEALGTAPHDSMRSYASQLFQTGAINSVYKSNSDRIYQQSIDGTEVVTGKDGRPVSFSGFLEDQTVKAYEQITGHKRADLIVGNTSGRPDEAEFVSGFATLRGLTEKLEAAKAANSFPFITFAHTSHEPFRTNAGSSSSADSWHAFVIRDYDPSTGMVQVDNQWGKRSDVPLSLRELYIASAGPK